MVGRRNSDISAKGKEIILHPKLARVVNEKHEKAKRETPRIPMEVLQTVVVKFVDDVKTVASIAMASKSLNEIVEDDVLWSRLYALKFPMPSTPPPKGKWKELYVFQAKFMKEVLLNKNLEEILERAYPRWQNVGSISLPVPS